MRAGCERIIDNVRWLDDGCCLLLPVAFAVVLNSATGAVTLLPGPLLGIIFSTDDHVEP